jgi:hypothetical protein
MTMLRPLLPYDRSPVERLSISVAAGVAQDLDGSIRCVYEVHGDLSTVRWPARANARRRDGLWEHTCFEAFVGRVGDPCYLEFNWAPSQAYAAYSFDRYRERGDALVVRPPSVTIEQSDGMLRLIAALPATVWPRGTLEVGLSAVLEDAIGKLHYFALCHPRERPDFHDRRGFVWLFEKT